MRFAIAYGKDDPAGTNIVQQLKKISFTPQIPIIKLKKHPIYSENIDKTPEFKNIDFIIFASTHRSEKNQASLSLHAPGNWRDAKLGGKQGKICPTSAQVLKYLFQNLNKIAEETGVTQGKAERRKPLGCLVYEITLECTHHGPLIKTPCCFIEIGSGEKQWKDKKAGEIIAKTILSIQNYKPNKKDIPAIGIGGPHYCPSFNKVQLNSNYAISHIIPQYVLPLTENMVKQAEKKTTEQIPEILIDWKGCGNSEQRQNIIKLLDDLNLKYKRTKGIGKD